MSDNDDQPPATQPQATEPTTSEHPPPSYASHDSPAPPTLRETALEGLDGILAIGPYSGDAVRMMAGVKEFAVKGIALDGLFERVKCDLKMLEDTVTAEEARVKVPELAREQKQWREQEQERDNVLSEGGRLVEAAKTMQRRYVDLLWETRDLATKVEAHLSDFVNTVLPCVVDYTASEDKRHTDLRTFINRPKPSFTSPEGQNPVQAFLRLEQDLKAFLNETIIFAVNYHQNVDNRNEVSITLKETLAKQSQDCQDILTRTPAKIGLTLGATAVGAVTALPVPIASAGIAAAGLGVAVAETVKIVTNIKKILDVNKQQKSLVNLHELARSVERVSGIKTRLIDESGRVPNLSQLSQSVLKLWDMAAEDAAWLDGRDLDDIIHDEDLLLRIENITITYKAYTSALKEFATSVSSAGVFAGRR